MSTAHFLKEDLPTLGRSGGRFSRENGLMCQARVLIVHPEPSILALLGSMLQSLGHQIEEATSDRVAVRRLERGGVELMIAGIDPNDPEAMELVSYARRKHPHVPLILLFPAAHPERNREANRLGVTAVLKFPMPATELRAAVTQACEQGNGTSRPELNGSAHPSNHRRADDEPKGFNGTRNQHDPPAAAPGIPHPP